MQNSNVWSFFFFFFCADQKIRLLSHQSKGARVDSESVRLDQRTAPSEVVQEGGRSQETKTLEVTSSKSVKDLLGQF